MSRVRWPVALATLFLVLLGWYLVYTQRIVQALRSDAETLAEIYAQVQGAVVSTDPAEVDDALFRLQDAVIRSGLPVVQMGAGDTVVAHANLPFDVDIETPEGQRRVREYVRRLDQRNPPVGDPNFSHLHYGESPELRQLRWIPWLQASGLLLTVLVGFTVIRYQRRAESERAWTAMARELAHQLGTPISSLQGWLEVLGLPPDERPGEVDEREIASALGEDLVRLERISHRFELIGREPELEVLSLPGVVRELERYLLTRLPRFGPGVRLDVDIPADLPMVRGNQVLLAWALENVVKNALDALAGTGGTIEIGASRADAGHVMLRISDDGPGVSPEIRDRIFEPGVTSKAGGWGVGLALSRRIVEGVHGGRIQLLDGRTRGATFEIRLPAA